MTQTHAHTRARRDVTRDTHTHTHTHARTHAVTSRDDEGLSTICLSDNSGSCFCVSTTSPAILTIVTHQSDTGLDSQVRSQSLFLLRICHVFVILALFGVAGGSCYGQETCCYAARAINTTVFVRLQTINMKICMMQRCMRV